MNLLLINYEYPPVGGGAANATYYIAQALAKQGHKVVVLTSGFQNLKGITYEKKAKIYRLNSRRIARERSNVLEMMSFVWHALWHCRKIVKQEQIQSSIAFFTIPGGIVSWYLFRRNKIPYIISLRGGDVPGHVPTLNDFHKSITKIRQGILKLATAIVANSQGLKQRSLDTDNFKTLVIPNGVDSTFFKPNEEEKIFAEMNFMFVGRIHPEKNMKLLLQILAELKKEYSFKLHVVGDGSQKPWLMYFAEKNGLANSIQWYGWMEKKELLTVFRISNCFVNPSLYEGMPNAVLEAMSCGLPVIASNVSGNDALVKHNETGFLFDLNKPDELKKYLQYAIENPNELREMGIMGRKTILQHFSWDKVADEYVKLFELKN